MPLHRGHQLLIESALAEVDDLTVVVYDSAPAGVYPAMPIDKRAGWISSLFPQIENIVLRDDIFDGVIAAEESVDPKYARDYADDLAFLGQFDRIFSSEVYGDTFARAMGAVHVQVDASRTLVPDQRHCDQGEHLRTPRLHRPSRLQIADPEGRLRGHRVDRKDNTRCRARPRVRHEVGPRVRSGTVACAGRNRILPRFSQDRTEAARPRGSSGSPQSQISLLRHQRVDDSPVEPDVLRLRRRKAVRARRKDEG